MTESSMKGPLADLERRWAEERSPRVALHLAEEHRRLGNHSRAIEILEDGLTHHPEHPAARVALGRYLLEVGNAAAAAESLELVVASDPTHLVANKLLVDAALELGDIDRARNRLDLYSTLNETDPDIEGLEARLDAAESSTAPPAPEDDGDGPPSTEASPIPDDPAPESRAPADDPFSDIWSAPDRDAYSTALGDEGIFALAASSETGSMDRESAATAPVQPAEEPAEVEEATVTLGKLYLEQGHREEAQQIFSSVLESQPEKDGAIQGLAEAASEGTRLTASDLVTAEAFADAALLSERKRLVLESYRDRLRAGKGGSG